MSNETQTKPNEYSHALPGGVVVKRCSHHLYTHVVIQRDDDYGWYLCQWSSSAELAAKEERRRRNHGWNAEAEPINGGVRS